MRVGNRTSISLVLATALFAVLLPVPATAAGEPRVAKATWEPCFSPELRAECDVVRVPLDYDEPTGRQISVAMVRIPASDPARRIGSLFVNPGGPGGSGVDFVLHYGASFLTDAVQARFDIVGFDPRGIGRSNPLRCFDHADEWGPYFTPFSFPINAKQTTRWIAADRYMDAACADRGNRIMDHMSTANAARDLDVLRRAVGDSKLTYYGLSYGSFLGQVYANLFPDRIRAVAIDGVIDPIAWTTGKPAQRDLPFSTRLRSDAGARATLDEFFRLCDAGGANCAFSGHASDRYQALAERLLDEPLQLEDPESGETFPFRYQDLISVSLGAMYDQASWPGFARFLASLEAQKSAAHMGAAYRGLREEMGLGAPFPETPDYQNSVEGFPGVACADADNPDDYTSWSRASASSADAFGYFGPLWTWRSSICAEWPGRDTDRYTGPWDAWTSSPVLIVGNAFDPATRYRGAVVAHQLLPNSVLLTVDVWAHTSLYVSCPQRMIAAYLLRGATPPPGTICEPDAVPFAEPYPSAAERTIGRELRARLIPQRIVASLPDPGPR